MCVVQASQLSAIVPEKEESRCLPVLDRDSSQ
jgi:hypothetical protein